MAWQIINRTREISEAESQLPTMLVAADPRRRSLFIRGHEVGDYLWPEGVTSSQGWALGDQIYNGLLLSYCLHPGLVICSWWTRASLTRFFTMTEVLWV